MNDNDTSDQQSKKEVCGLIMPISASEAYTEQHWLDVKSILEEAISLAGFRPNLVSDADDVGIIHNRIVGNLGKNPIVVCDVSSKNPNVMFELGLRLAFDKPTIVVKDNITNYSFDTSPIEHVAYPVDLSYHSINTFKKTLKIKLEGTYKASKEDPEYSTFLKHFVLYKKKLEERTLSSDELTFKKIEQMFTHLLQSQDNLIKSERGSSIDFYTIETTFNLFTQNNIEKGVSYTNEILLTEFLKFLITLAPMTINDQVRSYARYIINKYVEDQISKGNADFSHRVNLKAKKSLLTQLRDKYGENYIIEEYDS